MEPITWVTIATLLYKLTSVTKYLTDGKFRAALTQVIPWVAGVLVIMLVAQADVAETLTAWGNTTLANLDGWSQVLAGIAVGSSSSVIYDFKKSFDNTDSAAEPPLLAGLGEGGGDHVASGG